MENGYHESLCQVAKLYEQAVAAHGGKSLSRVATIVASSGAFFDRLQKGKTFTVANLERFLEWFRNPANWPEWTIPSDAKDALVSVGRPAFPVARMPHKVTHGAAFVACDNSGVLKSSNIADQL